MRGLVMVVALTGSLAWGDATVTFYPLDIVRSPRGVPAAKDAWTVEFRKLMSEARVVSPSSVTVQDTLASMKRTDCDRENECLKVLAVKTNSLYAVYVSIDAQLTDLVATGRVVRDDGVEVSRVDSVRVAFTSANAVVAGKAVLGKVMAGLNVQGLPAVRPVVESNPVPTPPVVVPDAGPPPSIDAGVAFTPPPPPPLLESPLKPIGIVLAVTGGGVALGGLIALLVGRGQALAAFDESGALRVGADVRTAQGARTLQGLGVGLLSAGLAAAATGLVLTVLAPGESKPTTVLFAPAEGGGLVVLKGDLP